MTHPSAAILLRVDEDPWGGAEAAKMYADLGKILRQVHGPKRKYTIIEDGDPKGYQSAAGRQAKIDSKIIDF